MISTQRVLFQLPRLPLQFLLRLFAIVLVVCAPPAFAQDYPSKPIRLIVPYSPGGGTDVLSRAVGEKLSQAFGQPVLVENRPGANGAIGSEAVARAAPDGYSLVVVTNTHVINPYLQKVPFDTLGDFTPITFVAISKMVLVSGLNQPFSSIQELIAYAKANPGKVSIGNSEAATMLTGELFKMMAGVDLQQVAYKGGAPLMTDVVGGHIPVAVTSVTTVMPHYKSQKLRVLGVSSKTRSSALPDVPTIAEAGVPGYEVQGWYAMLGPKDLPRGIAERLQKEIAKIVATPAMHERFETLGAEAAATTPSETAAIMKADMEKWAGVIKKAGIQPQ
jgi:tripartite-type tricarboxylate transporter receptor subunit TctC